MAAARAEEPSPAEAGRRLWIRRRAICPAGDRSPDGVSLLLSAVFFIESIAEDPALLRVDRRTAENRKRAGSVFQSRQIKYRADARLFNGRGRVRGVSLWGDGNLEYPVALVPKQVVRLLDLVEFVTMRDERAKIDLS